LDLTVQEVLFYLLISPVWTCSHSCSVFHT